MLNKFILIFSPYMKPYYNPHKDTVNCLFL